MRSATLPAAGRPDPLLSERAAAAAVASLAQLSLAGLAVATAAPAVQQLRSHRGGGCRTARFSLERAPLPPRPLFAGQAVVRWSSRRHCPPGCPTAAASRGGGGCRLARSSLERASERQKQQQPTDRLSDRLSEMRSAALPEGRPDPLLSERANGRAKKQTTN